jgi:hypothetical protein
MVAGTFQKLITCVTTETDPSFLTSLHRYFTDSLRTIGGTTALGPEFQRGIVEATKRQLRGIADQRRCRTAQAAEELGVGNRVREPDPDGDAGYDDSMLLEEMENFALEDMAKLLMMLNSNHRSFVAVASEWWEIDGDDGEIEQYPS